MHPKSKKQRYYCCCCCCFFFIQVGSIILSIIPGCYCQQYEACSEPFQCGGIRNVSYPFWGSNRSLTCGYPGLELSNCQGDDVPLIILSSRTYRVLEIDYGTETLTVARDDLWNDTCPYVLYNTTLDQNLFEFPSDYNYKNVTLYYDCTTYNQSRMEVIPSPRTSATAPQPHQPNGNNQFSCYVDGSRTMNFFAIGEASQLGSNVSCNNNISVPVNPNMASALSNTSAPLSVLMEALVSGFSIHWLANNAICEGCVRSDGVCVYNQDSALTACHQKVSITVVAGGASAPSPLPPEEVPGFDPTKSPAPVPGGGGSQNSSGSNSGLSDVEKIVLGLVVSITGLVIGSLIIVWLKRRRSRLNLSVETNQNVENFLLNHGSLAPKRYNYSEIKKITKSFYDKLGQGGYGSVYKGMLPDGSLVAVKLLTETSGSGDDFINEVASISRTSHVNIVNLLGFCYERNNRALIYEFMPNQSLDKFISSNASLDAHCSLEWETLFKIAVGVARGLEYLHRGCNTRIVHFDIKPQNILLDEDFCPKISDFGLAKLCKKKQSIVSMIGTRGTVGYIAPEVFSRNFGRVSHKSDVYSYGMMVLEMAGAKNIVGIGSIQSSDNYFPDKIYEHVVLCETKNLDYIVNEEEEEEESKRKMFLVGFWCIQTIPSDRPSMSKVVEMLEGSLKSIQIPPKPFLFSPMPLRQEFSSSDLINVDSENSIEDD